jgi:hypothetical protein
MTQERNKERGIRERKKRTRIEGINKKGINEERRK